MTADKSTAERAIAIDLLQRALALMDQRGFGLAAAPHIDLGLYLLGLEAGCVGDQPIDDR